MTIYDAPLVWTTAYDTKNLVVQYHTQNNRRVRQIDMKKIEVSKSGGLVRMPLDRQRIQDVEDVTPN